MWHFLTRHRWKIPPVGGWKVAIVIPKNIKNSDKLNLFYLFCWSYYTSCRSEFWDVCRDSQRWSQMTHSRVDMNNLKDCELFLMDGFQGTSSDSKNGAFRFQFSREKPIHWHPSTNICRFYPLSSKKSPQFVAFIPKLINIGWIKPITIVIHRMLMMSLGMKATIYGDIRWEWIKPINTWALRWWGELLTSFNHQTMRRNQAFPIIMI